MAFFLGRNPLPFEITVKFAIGFLCLTVIPFAPANADDQTPASRTKLYGRVDDFANPSGPTFPESFDLSAKSDSRISLPESLIGAWHGALQVVSCRTEQRCYDWDAGFARGWDLAYKQARTGEAALKISDDKNQSGFVRGFCIFSVPFSENKETFADILSKFADPTPDQIAVITDAMSKIQAPVIQRFGLRGHNTEVLGNRLTIDVESDTYQCKQISDNVWESDLLSTRTVHFPQPKPAETIYVESVSRVTRMPDESLQYENASARYSSDKLPLCSALLKGQFSKGSAGTSVNVGNVAIKMLPTAQGVVLTMSGGVNGARQSVLVPEAKLKRQQ